MTSCTTTVCGTGTWQGPVPGDPDNNVSLHANPAFGGIDVSWTYPGTNAHAVAHTLLYRSGTSSRDTATQLAVVSGNHYYDKIELEATYYYWIRIVSTNGTTGDWVGPASATSKTRKQSVMEDLTESIDRGVLAQSLKQDIDKITLNYSELIAEIQRRVAGDSALSEALARLQSGLEEAIAFVHTEIITRQDGDSALASQITTIAAANANNASAIITEQTARVTADYALTTQYNAVLAATGLNAAAIVNEARARTDADSALASQISTVQSTTENNIASVETRMQTNINTTNGKVTAIGALYTAKVSVNGLIGGFGIYNNGLSVEAGFDVDRFWVGRTGPDRVKPFIIDAGTVYIDKARIRNADIDTLKIAGNAVTVPITARYANSIPGSGSSTKVAEATITLDAPGYVYAIFTANQTYGTGVKNSITVLYMGGQSITVGGEAVTTNICVSDAAYFSAGTHTIYVDWLGQDSGVRLQQRVLFVMGVKR